MLTLEQLVTISLRWSSDRKEVFMASEVSKTLAAYSPLIFAIVFGILVTIAFLL